jgi:hypothetical protein
MDTKQRSEDMSRDSTEKPANPSTSPTHVVILGSGSIHVVIYYKCKTLLTIEKSE